MLKIIILIILIAFLAILSVIGIFIAKYNLQKKNYIEFWEKEAKKEGEILYVALGDSTATAIGARKPTSGYVWQIKEKLEKKYGKTVKIVNLGNPGDKTIDLIKNQLPKLKEFQNPDFVTVTIGANDTNHKVEKEEIIKNLNEIIAKLPEGSFLAEIPPLRGKDPKVTMEINTILKLQAAKKNIIIVPLFLPLQKTTNDLSTYDYDFFHPNDKGYKIWADTFWDTINK